MQLRERRDHDDRQAHPGAANKNTSKDAVYDISVGTSMLYGSDVLYKTFVTPDIAKALNAAGIPIGAPRGQQINSGQIVTDLGWLQSTWIADKIGAQLSTTAGQRQQRPARPARALAQLRDGRRHAAQPAPDQHDPGQQRAPTLTLNVTNGGDYNEYEVGCSVTISSLSDTGTVDDPARRSRVRRRTAP